MAKGTHNIGVNELNLVTRHLKISPTEHEKIAKLIAVINEQYGVDFVNYNHKKQMLNLAYDATNINLEAIELIMEQHHIVLADTWWNHIKEDYYKFVDQNIKDNANHQATCCHKPPIVPSKNKRL